MYPHERSLVEQMKDKPFALLGINSDPKENVLAALKRENITWRSWWDGPDTSGRIASQYEVRGWPTIYVVDHLGVIRYKNVRGEALDKAVEVLLAEIEGSDPASWPKYQVVGGSRQVRTWTDNTGTYKIEAEFVSFKDGKAELHKSDGETIVVPMAKLSKDDQTFIRELLKDRKRRSK